MSRSRFSRLRATQGPRKTATQDAKTPQSRAPRGRNQTGRSDIELEAQTVRPCETRIALSASLTAAALVDVLDIDPQATLASHPTAGSEPPPPTCEPQLPEPHPSTPPVQIQSADSANTAGASGNAPATNTNTESLLDQAARLRDAGGPTGAGQTVAVIDSGIAWDHVALGGGGFGPGYRVVGGWDFAENDNQPYDDGPAGFHGTHVAGLIAGDSATGQGIAPEVDLVALRVFDDQGAGELPWIESALQWVIENENSFDSPITTVNLSVGAVLSDANRAEAHDLLGDELAQLRQQGILVFAAAGNFFDSGAAQDTVLFPASDPNVVAVSSVDSAGELSDFAQRSPGIFAADGEAIPSSVPDHVFGWDGHIDDYAQLSGTSMATPQVAAASVLVRSALIDANLDASPDAILTHLQSTAVAETDSQTGEVYYRLDLQRAVESIRSDAGGSDPTNSGSGESSGNSGPEPTRPGLTGPDDDTSERPAQSRFDGSGENEAVTLDLREGIQLRVGEQVYNLAQDAADVPIVIDVGGGADSLEILGSPSAERVVLRPGDAQAEPTGQLSTNTYQIDLRGFEEIRFDGGGGSDRATLYDAAGDDILRSEPNSASLQGVGFDFQVLQVPRIYVHATAGGSDTAFLYDSAGDDQLSVRPQFTSLRGDDAFQAAYGFEKVRAYATAGGTDTAEIYDSAGDDVVSISPERSLLATEGYQANARGFESVVAHSVAGGSDEVRIYSDETASEWFATADLTQWTSEDGVTRLARGFDRRMAFENFEPVAIQTLDLAAEAPTRWLGADTETRHELFQDERVASQSVFEQFGKL